MKPIFLKPVLQEKIWGGDKLKTDFKLEVPSNKVGEAWCISAHKNGVSVVTSPKEYANLGLDTLYKNHPALFGNEKLEEFPLLIKILDAKDNLSVQVHPDDKYAKEHVGELGKTECWYIISAEKDAKIIYGHNAKSKKEFEKMVKEEDWQNLLVEVNVHPGDFFYVPAGTIHAIGKGCVILETQQSSDTTFRVYDYDRKDDNGNKRDLHIKESVEVTTFPQQIPTLNVSTKKINASSITHYLTNNYFSVYKWKVVNELDIKLDEKYTLATVISGQGKMEIDHEVYYLKGADSFILPTGIKEVKLSGNLEIITSNSNSK